METKQEITKKFIIGIIIIVISFILGFAKFLIILPGSGWRKTMMGIYIFSWILVIPGMYLAGMEGYRLVAHKYRDYHRRTLHKVKEKSRKAATKVRDKSKSAARKTADVLKSPVQRRREKRLAKKKMKKK